MDMNINGFMPEKPIGSCPELTEYIQRVGFLPLLDSGIAGYSAEELVEDDCRYVVMPDGGWDWPLWKWKGQVAREGDIVYGKFFAGKAGFVSREWWCDLCNYRRHVHPAPVEGSIEEAILLTLQEHGSMVTRDLRKACGFTGEKMRSRFDAYITRLQMSCRIVTEDFVYPRDRHGKEYGWGWSLLTTPEQLMGVSSCTCSRSPEESYERIFLHMKRLLPAGCEKRIERILK